MSLLIKHKFELSDALSRLLTEEQTKAVNQDLKFARRFLNVLVHRINKEIDSKIKDDESLINYDNPNWHLLQAERLGYRRALRKVLEFIGPIEE